MLGVGSWIIYIVLLVMGRLHCWWDPWLEGRTLKDRFNHLFELAENKVVSVLEMNLLRWK